MGAPCCPTGSHSPPHIITTVAIPRGALHYHHVCLVLLVLLWCYQGGVLHARDIGCWERDAQMPTLLLQVAGLLRKSIIETWGGLRVVGRPGHTTTDMGAELAPAAARYNRLGGPLGAGASGTTCQGSPLTDSQR